jgi:hypothetical protein
VRIGGGGKASGAAAGAAEKGGVWGVTEPPDIAHEIRHRRKRRRRGTRAREEGWVEGEEVQAAVVLHALGRKFAARVARRCIFAARTA